MSFNFDHVFICTSIGAAEGAGLLANFGLTEGLPNTHPGQGTACRRFLFSNAYIELLWVENPAEAQSTSIKPTRLWERWKGRARDACPFGFGFRPGGENTGNPPFRSWEYRPAFLPAPLALQVAANSSTITEPMLFFLPFAQRKDRSSDPPQALPGRPPGLRNITRLELTIPQVEELSPEMQSLIAIAMLQVRGGSEYLLELGVDGEPLDQKADFRPALPLVFRW